MLDFANTDGSDDLKEALVENEKKTPRHRIASLEFLFPEFGSELRTWSVLDSVVDLVSNITGGGVLSLPYAFQCTGPLIGVVLVLLTGFGSSWTIYVLISCGRRTGAQSYEGIARHVYGRWPQLGVTFLVLVATYICMVAYTIFLQGIVIPVFEQYGFEHHLSTTTQIMILELILLTSAPLCLPSKIRYLNFTATLNVIGVIVLAVILSAKAHQACSRNSPDELDHQLTNQDPSAYLDNGIPIIICSFLCHFNVLPVHNSLQRPTRRRLKRIIHWTLGLTSILYLQIGLSGYFYGICSGRGVEANIFSSFSNDDAVANTGRIALFTVIIFSYPYFVVPCRQSMADLLQIWNNGESSRSSSADERNVSSETITRESSTEEDNDNIFKEGMEALIDDAMDSLDDSTSDAESKDINGNIQIIRTRSSVALFADRVRELASGPTIQDAVATVLLLTSQLLISAIVPQVNIWWNILGSFVTVTLVFIFPCAAYIKLRGRSNRRKKWRGTMRWLAAHLVLSVSLLLMLICSLYSILEWFFL